MSPEPFEIPIRRKSAARPGRVSSRLLTATFPSDLLDKYGASITLDVVVTVVGGEHVGEHGRVVAWAGGRSILVLTEDADGDPEVRPDPVVAMRRAVRVDADDVECERSVALRAGARLEVVTPTAVPTALVVPVSGSSLRPSPWSGSGPFPEPAEFLVEEDSGERSVDVRAWAAASLAVLDESGPNERDDLVARHFDAPLLRSVLREAALPERLARLVLVVSDQSDDEHPDGLPSDTAAVGALLLHWIRGTQGERLRTIDELATPVVLRNRPEVSHSVLASFRDELPRIVDGCEEVVLVQSDALVGTQIGVLSALECQARLRVRVVQQVDGGPLVQVVVPAMVPLDDIEDAVGNAGDKHR